MRRLQTSQARQAMSAQQERTINPPEADHSTPTAPRLVEPFPEYNAENNDIMEDFNRPEMAEKDLGGRDLVQENLPVHEMELRKRAAFGNEALRSPTHG